MPSVVPSLFWGVGLPYGNRLQEKVGTLHFKLSTGGPSWGVPSSGMCGSKLESQGKPQVLVFVFLFPKGHLFCSHSLV